MLLWIHTTEIAVTFCILAISVIAYVSEVIVFYAFSRNDNIRIIT